jgi:endoglucanase
VSLPVRGALLATIAAGACAATPPSQRPAAAAAREGPVQPALRRGLNLGNALDAPHEGDWNVVLQPEHFRLARAAGFDHVRLPARFSAHAATAPPFTIDSTFMARLDWSLDQAEAHGLAVVLDMHHFEEMAVDPGGQRERFLALWRQIASHCARRPLSVAFELLNEPTGALTPELWNALAAQALAIVRARNPERLVVIGSAEWSSAAGLDRLVPPLGDAHLLATFHGYDPVFFSIQGAPWIGPEFQTTGVVFPGPPAQALEVAPQARAFDWVRDWFDRYNTLPAATNPSGAATIRLEMEHAALFRMRTGIPLYLGEFAAVDWADLPSRVRFYAEVRAQAEAHGIGWCVWDDGGHNRFLDVGNHSWSPELHAALFGAAR